MKKLIILTILLFLSISVIAFAEHKEISVQELEKYTSSQKEDFMYSRNLYCLAGIQKKEVKNLVQNYRKIQTYHAVWAMEIPQNASRPNGIATRVRVETAFDRENYNLFCLITTEAKINGKWKRDSNTLNSMTQLTIFDGKELNTLVSMSMSEAQTKTISYEDKDKTFGYRDFRRGCFFALFDLSLLVSPMPINEILQANVNHDKVSVSTGDVPETIAMSLYSQYETHARLLLDSKTLLVKEYFHFREGSLKNSPPKFIRQNIVIDKPLDSKQFDFPYQKELLTKGFKEAVKD